MFFEWVESEEEDGWSQGQYRRKEVERWRLIDACKHLEDDKTLRNYDIKHKSTVQMVERLHRDTDDASYLHPPQPPPRRSFPSIPPPPPGWSLPLPPGGRLRPCLHLQAGHADSATLALLAKDGVYAKDF